MRLQVGKLGWSWIRAEELLQLPTPLIGILRRINVRLFEVAR